MEVAPTRTLLQTPKRLRLSPEVVTVRQASPYTNYASPLVIPTGQPVPPKINSDQGWTGSKGYGSRHVHDDAPFTLWDSNRHDFRLPGEQEYDWFGEKFPHSVIRTRWPILVIETNTPPWPLPLTIGGVAVKFIPPQPRLGPFKEHLPIQLTTNYVNPRSPLDPVDFKIPRWQQLTMDQRRELVRAISTFCNPKWIHAAYPYIIIELYIDSRSYARGSLPCKIAGCAAIYHHQATSVFKDMITHGVPTLMAPAPGIEDTADYLQANHVLSPEVRISSPLMTNVGQSATLATGTTAGILLRDSHSQQKLSVAHHGFLQSDDVFHPTEGGTHIGVIDQRFEHLDVALVGLNPSINFDNSSYFESDRPRRLLRGNEITLGSWFTLDGISTGLVSLMARGTSMEIPPPPPGATEIRHMDYTLFDAFGQMGTASEEGVCGAAIVECNVPDGGVAGFFSHGNGDFALAPCLDELVDLSWSVV
ncbi:MAG: hypothetical protein Q9174_002524 [Haloplaca sp. 1 TL-2023]